MLTIKKQLNNNYDFMNKYYVPRTTLDAFYILIKLILNLSHKIYPSSFYR